MINCMHRTSRITLAITVTARFRACSGGKRGATIIQGQKVSILRRYGNVVRHNAPPVRYVEYSVVVPTAASVANQPDGGAAAIAAAHALGAGSTGAGSRLGGGVGRGGGGGAGGAPLAIAAGGLAPATGLEYRLYHTQHRESKDGQGAASPMTSPPMPANRSAMASSSRNGSGRKRKLGDMAGQAMSASQSLMVDAALMMH